MRWRGLLQSAGARTLQKSQTRSRSIIFAEGKLTVPHASCQFSLKRPADPRFPAWDYGLFWEKGSEGTTAYSILQLKCFAKEQPGKAGHLCQDNLLECHFIVHCDWKGHYFWNLPLTEQHWRWLALDTSAQIWRWQVYALQYVPSHSRGAVKMGNVVIAPKKLCFKILWENKYTSESVDHPKYIGRFCENVSKSTLYNFGSGSGWAENQQGPQVWNVLSVHFNASKVFPCWQDYIWFVAALYAGA